MSAVVAFDPEHAEHGCNRAGSIRNVRRSVAIGWKADIEQAASKMRAWVLSDGVPGLGCAAARRFARDWKKN
jgi:hypothetical protein